MKILRFGSNCKTVKNNCQLHYEHPYFKRNLFNASHIFRCTAKKCNEISTKYYRSKRKNNNNPKSKRLVKGHEYKFHFVRGFYVYTFTFNGTHTHV